jgi:bifunctional UDP-N-acetylglucosamine pyrophosphorylase/glucosamine-1-phosphate N-acetyltransferase
VKRVIVIPAAGRGSRLGVDLPKLLVPVDGRPMIAHLIDLYGPHAERMVLVVAPDARARVLELLADRPSPISVVIQEQPTGMLDAILLAREDVLATQAERVLITWCDQVAIAPSTVEAIVAAAASHPQPAIVLPTCEGESPYVHLQRDASGRIVGVLHRREADVMPLHGESDAGVFDLRREAYTSWLPEYAAAPSIGARTRERNFLPFLVFAASRGAVLSIPCESAEEAIGINTPQELVRIEAHLRARRMQ